MNSSQAYTYLMIFLFVAPACSSGQWRFRLSTWAGMGHWLRQLQMYRLNLVYNVTWFVGCAFIVCYGPAFVNYTAPYADALSKATISIAFILFAFILLGVRWDLPGVLASHTVGLVTSLHVPRWMRPSVYALWLKATGIKMDEANEPDILQYPSLSAIFTRILRPGARPIAKGNILNSPVDGKVVEFGSCKDGRIKQVKDVTYSVDQFLGLSHAERVTMEEKLHMLTEIAEKYGKGNKGGLTKEKLINEYLPSMPVGNNLNYIVIYLAPHDYHRIHSPADWQVENRRHFPGTLFPVNGVATKFIPQLFAMNERVVLGGHWEHGYFSLAAVGAYNVGSIHLTYEPEFRTNTLSRDFGLGNLRNNFSTKHLGTHFYEKVYPKPYEAKRGDEQALFNFGSTVVLIFDAPSTFQFTCETKQLVKVGIPIGKW